MQVKKIFVIGSGQMGAGIAQVSAQAGYDTIMYDISDAILEKAAGKIRKSLEKKEKKGKLAEGESKEIMNRLSATSDTKRASDCDVVIEAAPEDEALKKKIFIQMDEICPEHTILATNTSAIPITKLGNVTKRPEKVIGMHFMNPVPIMRVVEVIRAYLTADETYQTTIELAKRFGKEVVTAQDFPGFMSTRLIMPFMNEALFQLYEGRGTKEDIDKCAKLALNHPMGPFEWMDFVGLDSMLNILRNLYEAYGDQRYFPCPLLVQMVQAGHLGRKTGLGFYDYTG